MSKKANTEKKKQKKKVKNISNPSSSKWYALAIMAFAFILFSNTLDHGYVLDDDLVLAKNKHVTQGNIGDIFTSSYHEGFTSKKDPNYRPMSMVAFAIEKNFAGIDDSKLLKPAAFHFFNVFWYALSCGLLFLFLLKILKEKHLWMALGISLLFVAHPIHTEVVASIKSRDEIFVFLGMIASLYATLKYHETSKIPWLLLGLFSYTFACFSKESGVAILGLIPITLFFYSEGDKKKILPITAFFLIPLALFFFMRNQYIGENGDVLGPIDNILFTEGITKSESIATSFGMITEYLKLLIFPHPLSYDYSAYQIEIMNFSNWKVILGLLSTLGLMALSIKLFPSKNPISWAILLLGIMFILVSNIFFPIGVTMAERLLFTPSLGFCFILGYLLYQYLYLKENQILFWIILGVIVAAYSLKTSNRNQVWESNDSLHFSGLETAPNSARALNFYGKRLYELALEENDQNAKIQLGKQAMDYYNKATQILPSYRDAYQNKGACALEITQDYNAAIQAFDEALIHYPNYNLALCGKGIALSRKGDNESALQLLQQAYEIAPGNNIVKQNYLNILTQVRDYYRNTGDIPTAIYYDKQMKVLTGEAIN